MSYLSTEASKHGGKPKELYKFEGTYADFFYTSNGEKVRYPDDLTGDWYLPIAIRRSEINCGTQEDDGLDITIELSVKNEIVQIYGFQSSPPKLDLTIFRFHDIADVAQYWTGPINDIQVANGVATIRSPSTLSAALDTNVPNFYFQAPCNHVLYDARCKVDYDLWSDSATVTDVTGRVITIDSVGTLDGKLVGGEIIVASGERRMITAQNLGELIVNFPFAEIAVNDIVTIAAGCDLAYEGDCKLKFNNNSNFGGFPFIPASNPFKDGIDPSIVPLPDNTCLPSPPGWTMKMFHQTIQGEHCNTDYDCDRILTHPNAGIYGDGLTSGFGIPSDGTIAYDYDGMGNLLYTRQAIADGTNGRHSWVVTFYYPVPNGEWTEQIQYPAFFCGSVGRSEHNIQILMQNSDDAVPTLVVDLWSVGGNYVYTQSWNWIS